MLYEWDEEKRKRNIAKRGIDFKIAEDFEWETAIIIPDDRKDYQEDRHVAFGYIGSRLYVMVFTLRGAHRRIISLRKANPREIKAYEETID